MSTHVERCKAVFNLPGSLDTSNGYALPYCIFRTPLNLTLPVSVQKGFSLNSLACFPLFLLFGESFHYPPPMDPPCPELEAAREKL
ncbi:hypothetical protein TNCV_4397361 [Trichonephila clavipes]|nr:hypothetical protein TNCV_4397361 [Trichonephila clavipes]